IDHAHHHLFLVLQEERLQLGGQQFDGARHDVTVRGRTPREGGSRREPRDQGGDDHHGRFPHAVILATLDNLTHSLFALTLARTPLGRAGRGTTATLLLASNAPDIDIVTTAGGAISYLKWHRGPTHGPLGMPRLGILTAGLAWAGRQALYRRRSVAEATATANVDPDASLAVPVAVWLLG